MKLPVGTSANGSIVGLTPSLVAESIHYTQKFWPNLTASELMGAYQTAAQYVMAWQGNTPRSMLQYTDPYADHGQLDQSTIMTGESSGTQDFTASANQGGMLPLRQTSYDTWASFSISPTNYWHAGTI